MHFDTKIAIVLDEQLAVWQKANVSAFLISGVAGTDATAESRAVRIRPGGRA